VVHRKRKIFCSSLKAVAHGDGEFFVGDNKVGNENQLKIKKSIDNIIMLNEELEKTKIKYVVFHAGRIHSFNKEIQLKKVDNYKVISVTFTIKEYKSALEKSKKRIKKFSNYAQKHDILYYHPSVMF